MWTATPFKTDQIIQSCAELGGQIAALDGYPASSPDQEGGLRRPSAPSISEGMSSALTQGPSVALRFILL
jgi:hypothetical protein